jgi:flagellar biosynthesis protein FlhF
LQQIRSDLGKDAIILNTNEIRSGGLFGLFGKKRIEVIAATDTPPANAVKSPPNLPHAANLRSVQPHAAKNDPLLSEIKEMKQMVQKLAQQSAGSGDVPEAAAQIERKLAEQEFAPELARQIVQHVLEHSQIPPGQWTKQEFKSAVRSELLRRLRENPVETIMPSTKIVHFVGPTGVGKTTTIAKLAAEQAIKMQRKVGFITSDTYRIAAVEQLKTYASILNAPMKVIFSPQELNRAYAELENCDIIFMDTAGRNYRNEMYVSELNSLLSDHAQSETYLVLSLTTKYRDMKEIAGNFSKFNVRKVLFTKLDETDTFGAIFNMIHDFPFQLSYVTYGQNVPDDISVINEQEIVNSVLGDTDDE